jgi:hypothetical protein
MEGEKSLRLEIVSPTITRQKSHTMSARALVEAWGIVLRSLGTLRPERGSLLESNSGGGARDLELRIRNVV